MVLIGTRACTSQLRQKTTNKTQQQIAANVICYIGMISPGQYPEVKKYTLKWSICMILGNVVCSVMKCPLKSTFLVMCSEMWSALVDFIKSNSYKIHFYVIMVCWIWLLNESPLIHMSQVLSPPKLNN